MARIRTIKPELASDRKLAGASREARYTFVLLISQADDDGLLRAEPRQLLGTLYPFDYDVTSDLLEAWLAELVRIGGLRWRRTVDGMRVAELVNWSRHQRIKNRSKPFLLNHLTTAIEPLTEPSPEPTEDRDTASVGAGGAESRVLSPESGVRGRKAKRSGGRTPPNGGAPDSDSDTPVKGGWPARMAEIWSERIGIREPSEFGRYLAPAVAQHGEEAVLRAAECYVRTAPQTEKAHFLKPKYFADQVALYIDKSKPIQVYDEHGEPTPEFLHAVGRAR